MEVRNIFKFEFKFEFTFFSGRLAAGSRFVFVFLFGCSLAQARGFSLGKLPQTEQKS